MSGAAVNIIHIIIEDVNFVFARTCHLPHHLAVFIVIADGTEMMSSEDDSTHAAARNRRWWDYVASEEIKKAAGDDDE